MAACRVDMPEAKNFFTKMESSLESLGLEMLERYMVPGVENDCSVFSEAFSRAGREMIDFKEAIQQITVREAITAAFSRAASSLAVRLGTTTHDSFAKYLADKLQIEPTSLLHGLIPISTASERAILDELLQVASIVAFVAAADTFSKRYACPAITRMMTDMSKSCELECRLLTQLEGTIHYNFTNLPKPEKNLKIKAEIYLSVTRFLMSHAVASEERMRILPSVFGFERADTDPAPIDENSESGLNEISRILKSFNEWEKLRLRGVVDPQIPERTRGALTFDGVELNIRVLPQRHLPNNWSRRQTAFIPAPIFQRIMNSFAILYKIEQPLRTLNWLQFIPTVLMRWEFTSDQRVYLVRCNTFFASLMLLFQDTDEVSFEAMMQKMNMSQAHLRILVNTLIKERIILRKRKPEVEEEILILNAAFHSTETLLEFHDLPEGEVPHEPTQAEVVRGGQGTNHLLGIQAIMARIAKRAGRIPRRQLIQETIWRAAPKFCPEPEAILEAIRILVRSHYLQLDDSEDVFIYMT
ncbi:uncharacterized protein LOC100904754 [Galendromus occidentalis]|uniref:Uncharacterized protein LOC100904754 n=1 Tax=Galendromus occidentalis TaxID=34638 RepID=A0AAJ7L3G0_9ACAR|nr:uncharacterized protein LOC100904754 [Galendromus occidentalis]